MTLGFSELFGCFELQVHHILNLSVMSCLKILSTLIDKFMVIVNGLS